MPDGFTRHVHFYATFKKQFASGFILGVVLKHMSQHYLYSHLHLCLSMSVIVMWSKVPCFNHLTIITFTSKTSIVVFFPPWCSSVHAAMTECHNPDFVLSLVVCRSSLSGQKKTQIEMKIKTDRRSCVDVGHILIALSQLCCFF